MSILLPPSLFDLNTMDQLAAAVAEPGYGVFPNLLSSEVQQELIELIEAKEAADKFVPAGVGAGHGLKVRPEIRSDSIIWLDPDNPEPIAETWTEGMQSLCQHFRSQLYLSVWTYEGHLARYPAEGFYKAHLDRHAQTLSREISIIAYLNNDWQQTDGGQLRIYTDKEQGIAGPSLDVLPQAGTVVVFRSADFWHEVLPSKRPRLSVTGWLRGREELPI